MKGSNLTAILIALAALMSFSQAPALNARQTPPTRDPQLPDGATPHEKQPRSLSEELNLTEQQRTNVLAVFEQMREKMELFALDLQSNADKQLQRILTPEQYQKLQSLSGQHERQEHDSASSTNGVSKIAR